MLDIGYVKPIEDEEERVDILLSAMKTNRNNLGYPDPVRTGLFFTKTYNNMFVTCISGVHYGIFNIWTPECMFCKLTKKQVDRIYKEVMARDDYKNHLSPWSEEGLSTVYGAR